MASDPNKWTVAEVADFFRNHAAASVSDLPNRKFPDMDALAQAFEETEVAGCDIIAGMIDSEFLKNECKIASYAMRFSIMHCFKRLKDRHAPFSAQQTNLDRAAPASASPSGIAAGTASQMPESESIGAKRFGEEVVVDERGKKRRKLDLSKLTDTLSPEAGPEKPAAAPRRDKRPIVQDAVLSSGYLPSQAIAVDKIFFGDTPFGQAIGDLELEGEIQRSDWDGSESWGFQQETKTAGEICFVFKQMRHLFQTKDERPVQRHGRDAIAILPYRAEMLPEGKARSALVVQMRTHRQDSSVEKCSDDDSDAVVIRENVTFLDADGGYTGSQQDAAPGEYDFMIEKYSSKKDSILPEFDPDESDSITSSLAEEIAQEEAERASRSGVLSRDEVDDAITDCVDALALKWREDKLPGVEVREAWTIWKRTKKSKTIRDNLIAQSNATISMLENRLEKQRAEILQNRWKSQDAIRALCETLQPTIEDREYQTWKIKLWHQKQEPYHKVRRGRHHLSASQQHSKSATTNSGVVDSDDRLSIEPAPLGESGIDEEYHTPLGSPAIVDDHFSDAESQTKIDVQAESPMADFIEQSPPSPLVNPPESARSGRSNRLEDESSGDDLPGLNSFVRPSQKPEPKSSGNFNSKDNPFEISSDSASSSAKKKTKKTMMAMKATKKAIEAKYNPDPFHATVSQVRAWDMKELIDRNDRLRMIIKLLHEAGSEMRESLQQQLIRMRRPGFGTHLQDTLRRLQADSSDVGSTPEENVMVFGARIYLAQCLLLPALWDSKVAARTEWQKILCDKSSQDQFVSELDSVLQKSQSSLFNTPKKSTSSGYLQNPVVVDIDSDPDDVVTSSPAQKRRQKLGARAINKQSQAHQASALQRQEKFNKALESQQFTLQDVSAILPTGTPSRSGILINPLKGDDEEPIYIDREIAPRIKDHQVKGVQFMWREITVEEHGRAQGCVLAHTMGLGKTMQTITVLVALDETARSPVAAISGQLPKSLRGPCEDGRQLRILILCPPVLLKNWRDEIVKWAPQKFLNVFIIEAGQTGQKESVEDWYRFGGILLMGYPLFRQKVPNHADEGVPQSEAQELSIPRKRGPVKDKGMARALLDGAEVVVADEAHALKNETAAITQAARRFKTRTRIAMTGTPMSNDVEEIYALISWVDPSYLGDLTWFNAKYATPIKAGLGKDSTWYEKRQSLKKLDLLQRRIGPKVDRATIEVLRDSLTTKVEFHLTLPLRSVQEGAYKKFVLALRRGSEYDYASQVAIFQWLALLTLLANHPLPFKHRLLSPPQRSKTRRKSLTPVASDGSITPLQEGEDADEEDEADEGARALGFSQAIIDDIVAQIADDNHILSAKMTIVMDIVRLSKEAGDKLIIFTQSIATLDYMGDLFRKHGIRFGRIDGKVKASKRMPILDQFSDGNFDLLIISTRAGGTGLNIQTANRVIIVDGHFNPAHDEQAIGRAYRLGQTKPVFVYRLVSGGTFEEDIWEKQVFKTGLALRVVDQKQVQRSANRDTKEYLYPPKPVLEQDVSGYLGRDPSVLDHILHNPATKELVRAIQTTETLQAEVEEPLTREEREENDREFQMESNVGRSGRISNVIVPAAPPPSTMPVRGSTSGKTYRWKAAYTGVMNTPSAAPSRGQGSLVTRLPLAHPPAHSSTVNMPNGLPHVPYSTMPSHPSRRT